MDVEILEIQEQYQHPKWGEIPMAYDQMILILDREASSTPVRVNFDPNIPSDDTEFKIIGFGQTEDEDNSDVLKEIVVDLLPNDQCKKEFSGMIHPDMMCIMGRKNGRQCKCAPVSSFPAKVLACSVSAWLIGAISFVFCSGSNRLR